MAPVSNETAAKSSPRYEPRSYNKESPRWENTWKPAAGYSYLPGQPISLTKDQEMLLLDKLATDLRDCSLDSVRNVYEDLTALDRQLTGMASYTDVMLTLKKHGVTFFVFVALKLYCTN